MVLGFNHNIRYRGELFHVQTEDSGRANPHIITLLYRGGTIIASAKTSYADIIKVDQLELVVESIMKDQHKEMMRRLKGGEFDARIFPGHPAPSAGAAPDGSGPAAAATGASAAATVASAAAHRPRPAPAPPEAAPRQPAAPQMTAATAPREAPAPPEPAAPPAPPAKRSLDEVILDYLITGEEK
jgi:hypothetical protein